MHPPRKLLSTDLVHDAYVEALVNARLTALRSLAEIASAGKDESEKRQAATTILKLPNPEPPHRPIHTPIPIRYMDLHNIRRGPGGELPRQPTPFELAQATTPGLFASSPDPTLATLSPLGLPPPGAHPLTASSAAAALAAAAGRADPPS